MSSYEDDIFEELMNKHSHDDDPPADIELNTELIADQQDLDRELLGPDHVAQPVNFRELYEKGVVIDPGEFNEHEIISRYVFSFNHETDAEDGHSHGCNKKQGEEPPCRVVSEVYCHMVESGLEPGDEYSIDVSAPGTGRVTYQITRVTPMGIFGFVTSSTVRELTIGEVE